MEIVSKINQFVLKQERIYFEPEKGEKPPKGVVIKRGPKGGYFYTPTEKQTKKEVKIKDFARKQFARPAMRIFEKFANMNQFTRGEWKEFKYGLERGDQPRVLELLDFLDKYFVLSIGKLSDYDVFVMSNDLNSKIEKFYEFHNNYRERGHGTGIYWDKYDEVKGKLHQYQKYLKSESRKNKVIGIDSVISLSHMGGSDTLLHDLFGTVKFESFLRLYFDFLADKDNEQEIKELISQYPTSYFQKSLLYRINNFLQKYLGKNKI